MVTIGSLWTAILLSSIAVWICSFLVWAISPHHKSDFKPLPDEAAARKALKPQNLAPGQYNIPHLPSRDDFKKPEFLKRFEEGPVGFLTVLPKGMPAMGKNMGLSLLFNLLVGVFIAYIASRTLRPGEDYLAVFRLVGATAWLAYGMAVIPDAIWFGRPWKAVAKHLFDALLYALLTAGFFGWQWPA